MHDLQIGSEDELCIKRRIPEPIVAENTGIVDNQPHTTTGVKNRKAERLNFRYKGIQQQPEQTIKKKLEQVAGKTISFATKVKDPKTFEQKYKTIDGKILTYTPHTAWVQTKGKQPRLQRNSGFASVPNPLINGPCCPSTLSDHVAYKSARRTGPGLRFLDIENPSAQRHPMFK